MIFKEVIKLIDVLQKLPLVGPRTAEKIAFYIVWEDQKLVDELIQSILNVKQKITKCSICFGMTYFDVNPCQICRDKNRKPLLCIVENFKDQLFIENLGIYDGKYHILEGLINPLGGKTPDKIRINELIDRIEKENIEELIFAIKSDLEGDITVEYITEKIKEKIGKKKKLRLSRLAIGIPAGTEIENIDKMTLESAINNRKTIESNE